MDFVNDKTTTMTRDQIKAVEDELVDSLFLMNSYWYLIALIGSYLYFVLKLGPQLMANRPPFDLKYIMIVYNFVQVVCNTAFLVWYFSKPDILSYFLTQSCYPTDQRPLDYRVFILTLAWVWFMLKVFDLVDTIFFVLRKKQSHVTFLHIYHHTSVVISVWLYMRYVRGEQASMIGILNSIAHFFMYLYYLLAALGPEVQKYLWWKKYITKLQMVQFWLMTAFFGTLLLACDLPPVQQFYNFWVASQGITFTVLFLNFYYKSYTKRPNENDENENKPKPSQKKKEKLAK